MSEDQFGEGYEGEGENSEEEEEAEDVEYVEEQAPQQAPRRTSQRTQRPPQKAPQGTPKRPAEAQRNAPPVKRVPPPAKPANPYKEGTKKFLVAQRLLAGDTDRDIIARELGVSLHTIYTVSSDLRAHSYPLKVDVKTRKSDVAASHVASHAPSKPPPQRVPGRSMGDSTRESPSEEDAEKEEKYFPGDVPQRDVSPPVSSKRTTRTVSQGRTQRVGMTPEEVADIVDEAVRRTVESMNPDVAPVDNLPGQELPVEDVQISGEKVNYRIALNPEIFFRYSVFQPKHSRDELNRDIISKSIVRTPNMTNTQLGLGI